MAGMNNSSSPRHQVLLRLASNGQIVENKSSNSSDNSFGMNTFNDQVMREKLPKDVYKKLRDTISKGVSLDMSIANSVAHAMKEWALSRGVTHFTHWFQPQTGATAEKHDSFIEYTSDDVVVERFSGDQLVQGEPDASSFPSGGMRSTFEARGYTMWDPSSPAFIMDGPRGGILCIPSVFISYTGEALDKKTPLLRSMEAISRSALKVLRLFGNETATRVVPSVGTEQEYFLVDKAFYNLRPDLRITGRTLQGAEPPKGQQLEDHYFGSIKERVLAFMQDSESELYKLGVPAKTRHNEVAPHQYEIAPIYAELNVGADRNHLIMEVLKKEAHRHGLALLLHEKPFQGINGSGKHNNWSMADSEGNNLLDPGKTPEENLQFLVILVSILRAVYKFGGLLRASVASVGNDHRLGANEAPPAIMSVFLGERLNNILDDIEKGNTLQSVEDYLIDLGISKLPAIFRDNTDRNRTSPFAFTGNKFEFRAVGSSASVSLSNTFLSAAVADSIDVIVKDIETRLNSGTDFKETILSVLREYIIDTKPIRFEGNNYSGEWEKEAEKRGLPNVKRTGYALDAFIHPENVAMLDSQGVFKKTELEARYSTKLEQYVMALEIEVDTFIKIADTMILPPALSYQENLLSILKDMNELKYIVDDVSETTEAALLSQVRTLTKELKDGCAALKDEVEKGLVLEDLSAQAKYFSDHVVDLLEKVRSTGDELETIVPDELWQLPKYSEMLFIL